MKLLKPAVYLISLFYFSMSLYGDSIDNALRSDFSKQETIKIRFEVNKRLFTMNAGNYRIENVSKNRDKIRAITDKIVPWAIMDELTPPEIARIIVYMYHADEAGIPFDEAEDLIPIVAKNEIPLKDFVLMVRCNKELRMAGIPDDLKDAYLGFAYEKNWDGVSILTGGRGLILAKAAGLNVNKTASLLFKKLPAKGAEAEPELLASVITGIIGEFPDRKKTENIVNNIENSRKMAVTSEDSNKGLREINAVASQSDKNISDISKIDSIKVNSNARIDKEQGILPEPDYTKISNKNWRMLNRNNYFEIIRNWLGTPYKFGNKTGKPGIDCSGFVCGVLLSKSIGVPLSELGGNSQAQSKAGKPVEKNNLRAGDLVFFSASPGMIKITHVGLVTSAGYFVHASCSRGVINDSLDKKWWRQRYVASRRIFSEVVK